MGKLKDMTTTDQSFIKNIGKPKIDDGNFFEVINIAIEKGRHVDDLKKYKEDYARYLKFFNDWVFVDGYDKKLVYCFKVAYLKSSPFWEKTVWRDIEIIGQQRFLLFADIIIDSMGWLNDHMHGFRFPDPEERNTQYAVSPYEFFAPGWEDEPHPYFKSQQVKINQVNYEKFPRFHFEFDFGDGHEFQIDYKGTHPLNRKERVSQFPRLTDQRGVGPEQYPNFD